ncbi:DUF6479 family protein [Streptomyces sp. NPDC054904]
MVGAPAPVVADDPGCPAPHAGQPLRCPRQPTRHTGSADGGRTPPDRAHPDHQPAAHRPRGRVHPLYGAVSHPSIAPNAPLHEVTGTGHSPYSPHQKETSCLPPSWPPRRRLAPLLLIIVGVAVAALLLAGFWWGSRRAARRRKPPVEPLQGTQPRQASWQTPQDDPEQGHPHR